MDLFENDYYQASIELNNTAVDLLSKYGYREALLVLREAVSIMSAVLKRGTGLKPRAVLNRLETARSLRKKYEDRQKDDSVQLIDFQQLGSANTRIDDGAEIAVVIRGESHEGRNADLESSIILHNFALVHYLISKGLEGEKKDELLKCANGIIAFALNVHNGIMGQDILYLNVIQSKSLLLGLRVAILNSLGNEEEVYVLKQKCELMRATCRRMNQDLRKGLVSAPAA